MNYDTKHHMAFLLSLAALPIGGGCVITDGDDDDDVGDDGDTGTNSASASASAEDTGTNSASATMSASAEDTMATVDEDSDSSAGSLDESGTTGGDIPPVCVEVGAHFEKCGFADAQDKLDECVYYVEDPEASVECVEANEAYYACLSTAACEDLEGKTNPCEVELDMVFEICAGTSTSTGDSGGSEGTSTGG